MWYHSKISDPELINKLKNEQIQLQRQTTICPLPTNISFIAGCDCALTGDAIFSVFVVFHYPSLRVIEVSTDHSPLTLPYIPGFLAFREIPGLMKAFSKLNQKPDLIMVDGQGILHPRRMGIATHLGIKLDLPTIGVAKKKLCGNVILPTEVGSSTPVVDKGETIGYAYLPKANTNPVYISPGHKSDLSSSIAFTKSVYRSHKLPEPTRLADIYSKKLKSQT